jgi:bifunctional enzyme CysN/CysC
MRELQDYLERHASVDLLRFSTAGSVDDGKSTLIGHMLHDAKGIFDDQLAALKSAGMKDDSLQFALLTDGLKSEREQGITIDVAYRYFSTPERRFIIADTPGHEQYTRNMATGASTANLAIILIDARQGVLVQSRRHAFIASLLGIPHIIVAINKMDLVDYDEAVFESIKADFEAFASRLAFKDLSFIPISALIGDNLVEASPKMAWYDGQPLLRRLETVYTGGDRNLIDFRFPVQLVLRPDHTFRGYAGQISSGVVRVGDEVMVLPSGKRSRISRIVTYAGDLQEAFAPQSVTLCLEDEIDLDRGDMLVHPGNLPQVRRDLDAMVVWMADEAMQDGRTYLIKHTTRSVRARVSTLRYRIDPNTLHRQDAGKLELNEIGRVELQAFRPLLCDPYDRNRATGAFIMIDPLTNATVAAGMILDRKRAASGDTPDSDTRERLLGQRGTAVWLHGGTPEQRSETAIAIEAALLDAGHPALALTGDAATPEAAALLCRAGLVAVLGDGSPDATVPADRLVPVQLGSGDPDTLSVDGPLEASAIVRALEQRGTFKV